MPVSQKKEQSSPYPVLPRVPVCLRDTQGNPLYVAEVCRTSYGHLSRRLEEAPKRFLRDCTESPSVRCRLVWRGYYSHVENLYNGSMAEVLMLMATKFKTFLTSPDARTLGGIDPDWNLTRHRFALEDFAFVSLAHMGGAEFQIDIDMIKRGGRTRF